MIIKISDVWACHMCSRGARAFFERHDLDYSDFLRNGIDTETLEKTGDAMALRVIEVARGRR